VHVVYVNTHAHSGGAAKNARQLHLQVRQLAGWQSTFLTAKGNAELTPDHYRLPITRRTLRAIPAILRERYLGHQYLYYPDSYRLRDLLPAPPDLYHLHNLHGWYFDLGAIPKLTREAPIVITLHDEWLYTGHCAYTLDCDRWQAGCGHCPDLARYPMIQVDGTAYNWRRKRRLLTPDLPIYIITPSQWLFERAQSTYLGHYPMRRIALGIDLQCFQPGDSTGSRHALRLPQDRPIILFAAGSLNNPFKDFSTLVESFRLLLEKLPEESRPYLVALGGAVDLDLPNLITPGLIADEIQMVNYYQAATLVVHAARADNLPFSVIEAQACGVPVIASRVGGVPEIISHGETGLLVDAQNPTALAEGMEQLLSDEPRRLQMGIAARQRAEEHFDLRREVTQIVDWYHEILNSQPAVEKD
jgi:glycosyltransferase involved in cell wall biosynthesis